MKTQTFSEYSRARFRANIEEAVRAGGIRGGAPDDDPAETPEPGSPGGAVDNPPASPGGGDIDATLKAKNAQIAKYEAEEAERNAAEQRRLEAKRVADEGAGKVLQEKQAELEQANARIAKFENAQKERADTMFDSLPEATRTKLDPFRTDLPAERWLALVEAESRAAALITSPNAPATQPVLPPTTGAPVPRNRNSSSYTPSSDASEFLENINENGDAELRNLTMTREVDEDTKAVHRKFKTGIRKMFKRLPKITPERITLKRANEQVE